MKAGLRKRFFAWMLKKGDAFNHTIYHHHKENLFHDVNGLVAEIGPGTGVNFEYLPTGINWIGIEPNEAFHELLEKRAKDRGIDANLLTGDALDIPLPGNSMDAFICTLVLCSVKDPKKVIEEIKRVLKPGGKLFFIEHVAAPAKTKLRSTQNFFNPFNRFLADGCNCNRETWKYIEQAGFTEVNLSHQRVKGTLKLHSPHIIGYAVK